jgi:molecular chaperone DnaK
MVNVSAKDRGTGKEQRITITASSGLSKDEVDRMMKDAEAHAEEDRKRREEIEARNRADQAVYAGEKMLQDMGAKLSAEDKSGIEEAIASVKSAMAAGDTDAMTSAMERLTQVQHKAAEAVYKQSGTGGAEGPSDAEAPGGPQSAPDAGSSEGDVIDAEVVDDQKK